MITLHEIQLAHYTRYGYGLPEPKSLLECPEMETMRGYLALLRLCNGVEVRRTTRYDRGRTIAAYRILYDPNTKVKQ